MEMRNQRSVVVCDTEAGGRSRTKQSDMDLCDVNAIVRRARSTGQLEHLAKQVPRYGDFTNVDDYLTCLSRVREAHDQFAALPSAVRDHCDNDPGELIALVMDPERRSEVEGLGMQKLADILHGVVEPAPEEPPAVPVVEPVPVVQGGE